MVDNRTNFAKDISTLLRDTCGCKVKVFATDIPHSVRAAEISAEGKSIFAHDLKGKVVESIKEYGVLVPAIARPRDEGGYELVAGHRRHRASELAGLETMPVIVRNLDDDATTIIMVDSNLQRENILPSERAFAYKMKLSAMKMQAGRPTKENCSQVGNNLSGKKSCELLAEQMGESKNQIFCYSRLTELIPKLLDMVDDKKIAFNPAVELSYLKPEEQTNLLEAMDMEQTTPSLSQAQRLKKFSADGKCTLEAMCAIMSEEKKGELDIVFYAYDFEKRATIFPKLKFKQDLEYAQSKIVEYILSNAEKGVFHSQIPIRSIIMFASNFIDGIAQTVATSTSESNENSADISMMFETSLFRFALSLYILDITGRADVFATVYAVSNIPRLIMPLGGAIADRFNRRNLMAIYDFSSSLIILCSFLLISAGIMSVTIIGAVVIILSIISAFA